jgi:hypothetical protein
MDQEEPRLNFRRIRLSINRESDRMYHVGIPDRGASTQAVLTLSKIKKKSKGFAEK